MKNDPAKALRQATYLWSLLEGKKYGGRMDEIRDIAAVLLHTLEVMMKAEQVRHSDVRPTSPIYEVNPFEYPNCGVFYAGDPDIPQDAMVWTVFESWSRYNPWLKKEVNGPIGEMRVGLTNALIGLDGEVI